MKIDRYINKCKIGGNMPKMEIQNPLFTRIVREVIQRNQNRDDYKNTESKWENLQQ